jgi:hypothetical protein
MPSHVKGQPTSEKQKIANRKWYAANKEHVKELNRCWAAEHPEQRLIAVKNSDQRRTSRRIANLEVLAGRPRPDKCEACGSKPDGWQKVLHWDHDHATGDFRGWICFSCNVKLGIIESERFDMLMHYLETHTRKEAVS